MRIRQPRRSRGFTLIEMMLIVGLVMILGLFIYPSIVQFFHKTTMVQIARETGSILQLARYEAVKRNRPARVEFDMVNNQVWAYADLDSNNAYNAAVDTLISRTALPKGVSFWGPGDASANGAMSVDAFPNSGTAPYDRAWVVYDATGAPGTAGAVRFGDPFGNYLEVRIRDLAGSRIVLGKWDENLPNPTPPPATLGAFVGESTPGHAWVWK